MMILQRSVIQGAADRRPGDHLRAVQPPGACMGAAFGRGPPPAAPLLPLPGAVTGRRVGGRVTVEPPRPPCARRPGGAIGFGGRPGPPDASAACSVGWPSLTCALWAMTRRSGSPRPHWSTPGRRPRRRPVGQLRPPDAPCHKPSGRLLKEAVSLPLPLFDLAAAENVRVACIELDRDETLLLMSDGVSTVGDRSRGVLERSGCGADALV